MVQVFGGVAGCEHEFIGEHQPAGFRSNDSKPGALQSEGNIHRDEYEPSQFCRRCGAWRGELGLEPTPELYVEHIVEIFREVRRVLRDDGTCWLNLGDSYAGSGYASHGEDRQFANGGASSWSNRQTGGGRTAVGNLKPKDLCGIPWRVAFALQADGWYLRSDIIWSKPNPMPESLNGWRWERHRVKVKSRGKSAAGIDKYESMGQGNPHAARDGYESEWSDCPGCPACEPNGGYVLRRGSWRPTKSHEYLFMLAKSDRYFADADAVRESAEYGRMEWKGNKYQETRHADPRDKRTFEGIRSTGTNHNPSAGRNRRTVWQIATAPYSGAHFATFPPALVEPCIKAATSERGCCPACGSGWARVVDVKGETNRQKANRLGFSAKNPVNQGINCAGGHGDGSNRQRISLGFRPTCGCGLEPVPSLVLDCFAGSGTTLLVARKLGRRAVGVDLSLPYLRDQARSRLGLDKLAAWRDGGKEVETKLSGLPIFEEMRK